MSASTNAVSFLGRLQMWQKLALLVAAQSVPAVLLSCFYFSHTIAAAYQARSELDGTRFLRGLGAVSAELLTHRGREYAFLSGDAKRRNDVIAQEAEVDRQIALMDQLDAQLGAKFDVSRKWQDVKAQWATLKTQGLQQSPEQNDQAHAAIFARMNEISDAVGIHSMTSYDPELSARTLVRVASDYAMNLSQYSATLRCHAVRAASKGYLGGDDRMGIRVLREEQLAMMGSLQRSLDDVAPEDRAALQEAFDSAKATADQFYNLVQTKLVNASNIEISGGGVYDAGVPTNRALKRVSLTAYDSLEATVSHRLARLNQHLAVNGGCTVLALALAIALARLITRSLSRPLERAVAAFAGIARGNYHNQIRANGSDEAAQVLRALEEMQGKLRMQIDTERNVAAENSRIRAALDKSSTGVVLGDANHRIIYVNEAAQATFTRCVSEIRKSLPAFDANTLRGAGLDALATDPARERRLLDALRGSEAQERTLGASTFRIVASPVVDETGKRIGTVMEWTERTQEVAIEREMQSMLTAVVGGNLSSRIPLSGKVGFFEVASRGVNQLADNLAEIVSRVKDAAGEVYRGSKEIASGNANLQQRTEQQSTSLEETASSMEQMTTTVRQNADNASEANQLAVAARDQAERGGQVVGKAVHAMADINASAQKIADIIGVIDEIAFQTNLLALNAAVEAARAGEQGRGFAVVASEVRTLAGRSATAAKEIKELIKDSVTKVEDGSVLVSRSGQTLEQIVASVKKVSDIVAEIAAASREQSAGIGQVNQAVVQMDQLTQQDAALVEQVTSASQAMSHEAHALHGLMSGYQLGDQTRTPLALTGKRTASPATASRETEPAPGAERRPPGRPGSSGSGAARKTNLPARAQPVTKVAVAGNDAAAMPQLPAGAAAAADDDGEWQEF